MVRESFARVTPDYYHSNIIKVRNYDWKFGFFNRVQCQGKNTSNFQTCIIKLLMINSIFIIFKKWGSMFNEFSKNSLSSFIPLYGAILKLSFILQNPKIVKSGKFSLVNHHYNEPNPIASLKALPPESESLIVSVIRTHTHCI